MSEPRFADVNQRNAETFRVALAATNARIAELEQALAVAVTQTAALLPRLAVLEQQVQVLQVKLYSGGATA